MIVISYYDSPFYQLLLSTILDLYVNTFLAADYYRVSSVVQVRGEKKYRLEIYANLLCVPIHLCCDIN